MITKISKNNKGVSLVSAIILIMILILIAFLFYEIVYVDIFNLAADEDKNNDTIAVATQSQNRVTTENTAHEINETSNDIISYANTISQTDNNSTQIVQNSASYKYYYNQLDEYGKIIYDGFDQNKENMKSGTYTIDFDTRFNDLLNTPGGENTLNIAFQSAWNAYTYDNADIFYIDVEKLTLTTRTTTIGNSSTHRVELSSGSNSTYLKDHFVSREVIDGKVRLLEAMREEIGRQLQGYSQYEQVREVHNWLINNIEYDVDLEAQEPYSIVGALTEGKAVCEGYARSFKYILDELNIPCVLVSGTGTNSNGETESHAWNYVQLNGNWYAVDVTWDDPVIVGGSTGSTYLDDETRYRHFLKGSNSFLSSHSENGNLTPNSMEFDFPMLSPTDLSL